MENICEKCIYKDKPYSVQCEEQCRGDYAFYLSVNGLKSSENKTESEDK